jgi:predicted nucleic acid-binding protein
MLHDIVIDTNVLMHAENPNEVRSESAAKLIRTLLSCRAKLCVDEGFAIEESRNRSLIAGEYLERLRAGGVGLAFIVHLARNGRVSEVSSKVEQSLARFLTRRVSDKRDRTFLRVAANAHDRLMTSHDFSDLPLGKRREIRSISGIRILDAAGTLSLLA